MGCGGSKMSDDENSQDARSNGDGDKKKKKQKTGKEVDYNFKAINVLVFRNGDEYDPGTIVAITRRRFRNWLSLLEHITRTYPEPSPPLTYNITPHRLKLKEGAVHKLYTVEGNKEARHFKDLEDGERYVAVHRKLNKATKYGTRPNPKWAAAAHVAEYNPGGLDSGESNCMYLKKRQFRPTLDDMWEDSGFDLKRGGKDDGASRRSASSDPSASRNRKR